MFFGIYPHSIMAVLAPFIQANLYSLFKADKCRFHQDGDPQLRGGYRMQSFPTPLPKSIRAQNCRVYNVSRQFVRMIKAFAPGRLDDIAGCVEDAYIYELRLV